MVHLCHPPPLSLAWVSTHSPCTGPHSRLPCVVSGASHTSCMTFPYSPHSQTPPDSPAPDSPLAFVSLLLHGPSSFTMVPISASHLIYPPPPLWPHPPHWLPSPTPSTSLSSGWVSWPTRWSMSFWSSHLSWNIAFVSFSHMRCTTSSHIFCLCSSWAFC